MNFPALRAVAAVENSHQKLMDKAHSSNEIELKFQKGAMKQKIARNVSLEWHVIFRHD